MALDSLPTELQCSFIRLLDPIGLMSLSQISQHFRRLIEPTPGHKIERLLQMETLEEYGGPMPFKSIRGGHLPDHSKNEYNDVRWACTSCLRLLARRCFGTFFIREPPYQKLMRDSALYDAPTTWEPVTDIVHGPTVEGDAPRGSDRQNRRCLECQYRGGELGLTSDEADGTAKVPVQENRRVLFYSEVDRYFPGLSDFLGCQIPKTLETMHLNYSSAQSKAINPMSWKMCMVRCPGCTRWKELRNFRLQVHHLVPIRVSGGRDPFPYLLNNVESRGEVEVLLKGACCNACYAKTNGRLELGRALGSWFRALIDRALQEVSSKLKAHVRIFEWSLVYPQIEKLKQHLREVEGTMPCFDKTHRVLDEKDIADLKTYREDAIGVRDQMQKDEILPRQRTSSGWGHGWLDMGAWGGSHKLCENVLEDLRTCKKLSEENPEAFAAWALDRDESTWDYEVEAALSRKVLSYSTQLH